MNSRALAHKETSGPELSALSRNTHTRTLPITSCNTTTLQSFFTSHTHTALCITKVYTLNKTKKTHKGREAENCSALKSGSRTMKERVNGEGGREKKTRGPVKDNSYSIWIAPLKITYTFYTQQNRVRVLAFGAICHHSYSVTQAAAAFLNIATRMITWLNGSPCLSVCLPLSPRR